MSSFRSNKSRRGHVEALDFDRNRRRSHSPGLSSGGESTPRRLLQDDASLLDHVVDGIIRKDRGRLKLQIARYVSFASAIVSCFCAGSISIFSLYGHLFLSRLHYNQYQINAISIVSGLALYLPVPLFGYCVDRFSPRPVSLIAGLLFGYGYYLAAITYRRGPQDEGGWPFGVMIAAFVGIGMGTCSMYLSATAACVKNFGRGNHKGLALALPIASFGLSGIWQSQVGSRLLFETNADGSRGDVDVFQFFCFLGTLLLGAGVMGSILQRVVCEEELIEEAVDELARSGILEGSSGRRLSGQRSILYDADHVHDYGTLSRSVSPPNSRPVSCKSYDAGTMEERRKTWVLNSETHRFVTDPSMWFLAGGFFLLSGPVESYINNLGTLLPTLYPSAAATPAISTAATHVAILAGASTFGRLAMGAVSDWVAPIAPKPTSLLARQRSSSTSTSTSSTAMPILSQSSERWRGCRISISRATLLLLAPLSLFLACIFLIVLPTSPSAQQSQSHFLSFIMDPFSPVLPILSTTLIGFANGASFSLVPIIISTVWGVSNFGTNWGLVATMPALGAALWSALYSVEYQAHAGPDGICHGKACFAGVVAGMAGAALVAAGLWVWARWGRGGWRARGIVV